jgi:hypothetical protein
MAPKTSRRVAASKGKKSSAAKGRKSSATKRASGAKRAAGSASSGRKAVSVENFVRCIRTLHDLGLVGPFVQSTKRAKLTLTMDTAAFERVKKSVNKRRQAVPVSAGGLATASAAPPPGKDPFDFASNSGPGGLATASVAPPPGKDPFDFGSNSGPGGLGGVKPLPGNDPFDF